MTTKSPAAELAAIIRRCLNNFPDDDQIELSRSEALLAAEALEQVEALRQKVTELQPAADCWDALSACYRITCKGYTGLAPGKLNKNGFAQATFNLWTIRGPAPEGAAGDAQDLQGRSVLGDFMLVALKNIGRDPFDTARASPQQD